MLLLLFVYTGYTIIHPQCIHAMNDIRIEINTLSFFCSICVYNKNNNQSEMYILGGNTRRNYVCRISV